MNGVQDKAPTWKEWLAMVIFVPPLFVAGMFLVSAMIEGVGRYQDQHDRCLKSATNGYDIDRCR